jgi:hypothetical protein
VKVKENRLALEYLPISALVEHEQNDNEHPPEQIAARHCPSGSAQRYP